MTHTWDLGLIWKFKQDVNSYHETERKEGLIAAVSPKYLVKNWDVTQGGEIEDWYEQDS